MEFPPKFFLVIGISFTISPIIGYMVGPWSWLWGGIAFGYGIINLIAWMKTRKN